VALRILSQNLKQIKQESRQFRPAEETRERVESGGSLAKGMLRIRWLRIITVKPLDAWNNDVRTSVGLPHW
jgi:hypothetical protein